MKSERNLALRRLLAFSVDWLVAALWGGAVFGLVMIVTAGDLQPPTSAWRSQLIGFVAMTLPFTIYFAALESSPMRASLGKRALGLVVGREDGKGLSFRAALARNAIKFIPWELGHIAAHQSVLSGEGGLALWVWGVAALALGVPVWWLASLLATGRAPYDRWTRARILRRPPS